MSETSERRTQRDVLAAVNLSIVSPLDDTSFSSSPIFTTDPPVPACLLCKFRHASNSLAVNSFWPRRSSALLSALASVPCADCFPSASVTKAAACASEVSATEVGAGTCLFHRARRKRQTTRFSLTVFPQTSRAETRVLKWKALARFLRARKSLRSCVCFCSLVSCCSFRFAALCSSMLNQGAGSARQSVVISSLQSHTSTVSIAAPSPLPGRTVGRCMPEDASCAKATSARAGDNRTGLFSHVGNSMECAAAFVIVGILADVIQALETAKTNVSHCELRARSESAPTRALF